MPRYFTALLLPDDVKDRLLVLRPPTAPGVRLTGRQELHLTLHFIGELTNSDAQTVQAALARLELPTFTITIRGLGRFSTEGPAQVLWCGVESGPDLLRLHGAVAAALAERIGFQPEKRPYRPHITLARLSEPAPAEVIKRYLEQGVDFQLASVQVNRFALFSSVFIDEVPGYREEATFLLR